MITQIEWQSIASLSKVKAGQAVLLYVPTYPEPVVSARWSADRAEWVMLGLGSVSFNFEEDDEIKLWAYLPVPDAE